MLNNVVGGVNLDIIRRTISNYGLERLGTHVEQDGIANVLLENALFYRRHLFTQSCSVDNANKSFNDMFANPLANLVWKVATWKFWESGNQESDIQTQITSFEHEIQTLL